MTDVNGAPEEFRPTYAAAERLERLANHFDDGEWLYTRRHNLKRIQYRGDRSGRDHPLRRVGRAIRALVAPDQTWERELFSGPTWLLRAARARIALRTPKRLPDGVLDGGAVITYWEETGEYLQLVQPLIGALLADLMVTYPDLPEVVAIASEINRIDDVYMARVSTESERPGGA